MQPRHTQGDASMDTKTPREGAGDRGKDTERGEEKGGNGRDAGETRRDEAGREVPFVCQG